MRMVDLPALDGMTIEWASEHLRQALVVVETAPYEPETEPFRLMGYGQRAGVVWRIMFLVLKKRIHPGTISVYDMTETAGVIAAEIEVVAGDGGDYNVTLSTGADEWPAIKILATRFDMERETVVTLGEWEGTPSRLMSVDLNRWLTAGEM